MISKVTELPNIQINSASCQFLPQMPQHLPQKPNQTKHETLIKVSVCNVDTVMFPDMQEPEFQI